MKPIIFNTRMVRSIFNGWKTQTRRIVKPQGIKCYRGINKPCPIKYQLIDNSLRCKECGHIIEYSPEGKDYVKTINAPYQLGDILYIRETWAETITTSYDNDGTIINQEKEFVYRTDYGSTIDDSFPPNMFKWKPSIHMPREAARIFLEVTDVKIQRLQEMTEKEAKAEGIRSFWSEPHRDDAPFMGVAKDIGADLCSTRRKAYQQLWDSIYLKRGYGWESNPWVWVIEFKRIEGGVNHVR